MKTPTLTLLLAAILVLSGCVTPGSTQTRLDPKRTANALAALAPSATRLALLKDPKCKPYLQAALAVLQSATAAGTYDPKAIRVAMDNLSVNIKELRTPETRVAMDAVFAVYSVYWGDAAAQKLDSSVWVKPVLEALRDGLAEGLKD